MRKPTVDELARSIDRQMPAVHARMREILASSRDVFTLPGGKAIGYECEIRDEESGALIVLRFPSGWHESDVANTLSAVLGSTKDRTGAVGSLNSLRCSCAFAVATAELAMLALVPVKGSA